ncbi:MAG: HD domain-containing phosphohydrolase [Candidatus Omnitrophota bacterium]
MPIRTSDPKKKIDYQKALRDFAQSMVHLRRPERLLKMITRFLERDLALVHMSLLVHDDLRDRFIFANSRGSRKVPVGLVRIDLDNPLIAWFRDRKGAEKGRDFLRLASVRKELTSRKSDAVLMRLKKTMEHLNAELAIPGYYKRTLEALLLFGRKKNGRPFTASQINFFQVLAQDCSMAIKTAEYHENLVRRNQELNRKVAEVEELRRKERATFYEVMRSLAQEIYAKDPSTFGHISQVEKLGLMTAREMGLALDEHRRDILSASLILHDVGKIGVPDHILQKPGGLDEGEWQIMKEHVEKGAGILAHLSDFREAAGIVRAHHENFNGTGYPRGLKGVEIPIEARIVSVVDAFHAIISTRVYRPSQSVAFAFEELKRCSGTQFDPEVVEAFIRGLKKELRKAGDRFSMVDFMGKPSHTGAL